MAAPTPPPSNPAGGRLFGTADLTRTIDQLTRVIQMATGQGARTGAAQGTPLSAQIYGTQQRMASAVDAHNTARANMQAEAERQRVRWQQQLRGYNRTISSPRSSMAQVGEATSRRAEGWQLYRAGGDNLDRNWQQRENAHAVGQAQMQAQLAAFTNQQRMGTVMMGAQAVGSIAGATRSYFSGGFEERVGQYGRRMALQDPGYASGGSPGERSRRAVRGMFSHGVQNVATSDDDLFGGMATITEQAYAKNRDRMTKSAAASAFITPGLGIQGAAQLQGEMGTAQAFYAAQQFGLRPTRGSGGFQQDPNLVANSLASRVFGGRSLGSVSKEELSESFKQGGSMSLSMTNWAKAAGLSGQSVEALRNSTLASGALQRSGLSEDEAQKTLSDAAENNDTGTKARKRLSDAGLSEFGGSYQDAQNFLKGRSREGHLSTSANYLDAAKASADTLADIYKWLQDKVGPVMELTAKASGALRGGGILGSIGALVSSDGAMSGVLGSKLGGLFGGASGTPTSKQGGSGSGSGKSVGLPSGNTSGAIDFARKQLGERYILGANGPDAWDCSSLMQAAYGSVGVSLPRVTYDQVNQGIEVGMDELVAGDLVFYGDNSHVGMVTGDGRVIEAANPSRGVVEGSMYSKFTHARRMVSGGVTATRSQSGESKDPTKSWSGSGGGLKLAAGYGSVEEVDALAAALGGGGGGVGVLQSGSRAPSSQQNKEAAGGTGVPAGPSDPSGNKAIGKSLAASKFGWSGTEWDALHELWMRESGWSATADNPTSTAYGIPQALEWDQATGTGHKMTGEYANYHTSASTQISWGLNYIKGRYGSPSKALRFHDANNWYDRGAWDVPGDQVAKVHSGEMVLSKQQATTVRQALLEQGLGGAPAGGGGSVSLTFGEGAVVIQMPTTDVEGARSAATSFVDFVSADSRIKSMMGGL